MSNRYAAKFALGDLVIGQADPAPDFCTRSHTSKHILLHGARFKIENYNEAPFNKTVDLSPKYRPCTRQRNADLFPSIPSTSATI